MPISRQVVLAMERIENQSALDLRNKRPNTGGLQLASTARYSAETFPLPEGLQRDEFKSLLRSFLKTDNSDLLLLELEMVNSGFSESSLIRIECSGERCDPVVILFNEAESYFQLYRLFKMGFHHCALGRHLRKDKTPESVKEAWIRCRNLPFVREEYDIVDFKTILRPFRLAPDFSTDPLDFKSSAPTLKVPVPTRWFFLNDEHAPRPLRLGPTPSRIRRVLDQQQGELQRKRTEREAALRPNVLTTPIQPRAVPSRPVTVELDEVDIDDDTRRAIDAVRVSPTDFGESLRDLVLQMDELDAELEQIEQAMTKSFEEERDYELGRIFRPS
jgi:hypothetical protein